MARGHPSVDQVPLAVNQTHWAGRLTSNSPLRRSVVQLRRAQLLLAFVALGGVLCSCASDHTLASSVDRPTPAATETPRNEAADPLDEHSPRRPQLMPDKRAPVARDLERLATMFVSYAVRDSDTFPHEESVSMAIGGHAVLSIDDIAAALSNREIWKICPPDWHGVRRCIVPGGPLGPHQQRRRQPREDRLLSGVQRRHLRARQGRSASVRTHGCAATWTGPTYVHQRLRSRARR